VATWVWVLIAVAVVVVIVVAMVLAAKQRSTKLRRQFGPEYERTMQDREGRRAAESDLRSRQKQREKLDIHALSEPSRARYAEQWQELQERFIDQPASTVLAADALVRQVMNDEGYPLNDFDEQAALVSVDHPRVVENYRIAHGVYERTQTQQASTEDMRTALLSYRALFDELLHVDSGNAESGNAESGNVESGNSGRPTPGNGARHRIDDAQTDTDAGAR
jgi:hypothetical protein